MTLFGDAGELFTAGFEALKAVDVSYTFAAGSTVVVSAWEGSRASSGGATGTEDSTSQYVDWIIPTGELGSEPTRGDKLIYGGDTYEVLPLNEGESPWEFSGIDRNWYRAHTKRQA